MRILKANKKKFRSMTAVAFAGIIGLTGLGLAPAATASSSVRVVYAGEVSKDYWDYISYYRSFPTSQKCVDFAYPKLRPKTWAECVYAEYQGQSGWFAHFMGTNQ